MDLGKDGMKLEINLVSSILSERSETTTLRNEEYGLTIVKTRTRSGHMGMEFGKPFFRYFLDDLGEKSFEEVKAYFAELE